LSPLEGIFLVFAVSTIGFVFRIGLREEVDGMASTALLLQLLDIDLVRVIVRGMKLTGLLVSAYE
jgi:hypothetical protein